MKRLFNLVRFCPAFSAEKKKEIVANLIRIKMNGGFITPDPVGFFDFSWAQTQEGHKYWREIEHTVNDYRNRKSDLIAKMYLKGTLKWTTKELDMIPIKEIEDSHIINIYMMYRRMLAGFGKLSKSNRAWMRVIKNEITIRELGEKVEELIKKKNEEKDK